MCICVQMLSQDLMSQLLSWAVSYYICIKKTAGFDQSHPVQLISVNQLVNRIMLRHGRNYTSILHSPLNLAPLRFFQHVDITELKISVQPSENTQKQSASKKAQEEQQEFQKKVQELIVSISIPFFTTSIPFICGI